MDSPLRVQGSAGFSSYRMKCLQEANAQTGSRTVGYQGLERRVGTYSSVGTVTVWDDEKVPEGHLSGSVG